MFDVTFVATSAVFGLAYGVLFTVISAIGVACARDFGVHAYPPAIRARYGAKSPRGERVTRAVSAAVGLALVITLTALMLTLRGGVPLDALSAFAAAEIALMTFNLYDLFVLDGLLFVVWRPAFIVLPGTEGMPEYRDFAFHARGFVKGIAIVTVTAAIATGLYAVVETVAG